MNARADPINLAEALAGELVRAGELRALYAELRGTPGVNVEPVIAMLDASVARAVTAQGSGDIVAMARALADLRGYET